MVFRPLRALPLVGLLLAACAVNPLTPTPAPVQPTEIVMAAAAVPTGAPRATQPPDRLAEPGLAPTEPTANVIGVVVVSTEVEIIEQATATQPPAPQPQAQPATQPAGPPPTQGPPPPTAIPPVWVAPPVSADVAAAEQYCIDLINAQRAAAGLPPYARDETVMGIARARVADMIARGYRGHNDPVTGASLARQMLSAAGFRLAGENWYGHRAGPVAIVDAAMGWFMTDPPHAQGILSANYTLVGVGIGYNGTQWLLIQNFAGS